MKLKNVNLVERHLEKAVLAAAVLFGLMVFWVYTLGTPYTAMVANREGLTPDQVEGVVLEKVEGLERQLNDPVSALPEIPVPPYTEMFRQRVDLRPVLVATLDPLGQPGLAGPFKFDEPTETAFYIPAPPSPVDAAAHASFGVMLGREGLVSSLARKQPAGSAEAGRAYAEQVAGQFASMVPEVVPRDFRYVTVTGAMDWERWRHALRNPPEGDAAPIPELWWRNLLLITDVVLERQTRDADAGGWGPVEAVEPLPGMLTLRESKDTWLSTEAKSVLQLIRDNQDQITTPPLDEATSSAGWSPQPVNDPRSQHQQKASLWGHDLTVQPGKTYRYRLRVAVMNPVFQRRRLVEQQRVDYFHRLALVSEPGPWTEPVVVEPEHRFFVVKGSGRQQSATVEVWRVFNGRYRAEKFDVQPGDVIGGVVPVAVGEETVQMDMRVGSVVVDLAEARGGGSFGTGEGTTLLYLDEAANQLYQRSVEEDRRSPVRLRLVEETGGLAAVDTASD